MSALSVHITRTVAGLLVVMSLILTPASALAAPPETGGAVHIVQVGETLSSIASRYGVTVEAIMAANGLANPKISLPSEAGAPATSNGAVSNTGRSARNAKH